MMTLWTFERIL